MSVATKYVKGDQRERPQQIKLESKEYANESYGRFPI